MYSLALAAEESHFAMTPQEQEDWRIAGLKSKALRGPLLQPMQDKESGLSQHSPGRAPIFDTPNADRANRRRTYQSRLFSPNRASYLKPSVLGRIGGIGRLTTSGVGGLFCSCRQLLFINEPVVR